MIQPEEAHRQTPEADTLIIHPDVMLSSNGAWTPTELPSFTAKLQRPAMAEELLTGKELLIRPMETPVWELLKNGP